MKDKYIIYALWISVIIGTIADSVTTRYVLMSGLGVETNELAIFVFQLFGPFGHLILSGLTILVVYIPYRFWPKPYNRFHLVAGQVVWALPYNNIQVILSHS